jgi:hypothetical protein
VPTATGSRATPRIWWWIADDVRFDDLQQQARPASIDSDRRGVSSRAQLNTNRSRGISDVEFELAIRF